MEGDTAYAASQELPNFPYADYAELIGLRGIRVERAEDLGAAWERALAADRPVVLEADAPKPGRGASSSALRSRKRSPSGWPWRKATSTRGASSSARSGSCFRSPRI